MKILQVIPYFTPKRGGDVNVVYNLSRQLVKRGHEVTIITTDFEFDEEYAKSLNKIQVIPFKCIVNIGLFLISPSMKKWLNKNIKNFDIMHLHDFRSYQNVVAHHYAKKYRVPYVLHGHGSVPRIIEKKILKISFDYVFGNRILRDVSKLIANSKAEVENYILAGAKDEQIKLLYNGIDPIAFSKLPPLGSFKNKYGISNKYILFLGRIDKTKGLDFFVKSFSLLLKEVNYPVSLVLVGPRGNFKTKLDHSIKELNIEKEVKFIDFLDGEEKISAYRDADIFVTTASYRSGVLLTPVEAIMCGTPVIVTNEIGELLENAGIGYIVKYGSINDLKEKMKYVLENPEEGKEMVEKGKKYIEENLTWAKVAETLLKFYSEVQLKR